jgi:hypothetical protein
LHYEFGKTLIGIFWCGCLPQMKENRQAYSAGMTDFFEKVLFQTFQTGRDYAQIEETNRMSKL